MAPGRGKKTPARARQRQCRKCGADEWYKSGGSSRCLACKRRLARESKRRRSKNDPASRLFESARARSKQRDVEFALELNDVRAVWPKDHRCPALGIVLRQGKGKVQDESPTLDRINSAWGYVPGNIAVISNAANRAKGALTAEQLSRIAAWMRAVGLA